MSKDAWIFVLFCFPGVPLAVFLAAWVASLITGTPMFP